MKCLYKDDTWDVGTVYVDEDKSWLKFSDMIFQKLTKVDKDKIIADLRKIKNCIIVDIDINTGIVKLEGGKILPILKIGTGEMIFLISSICDLTNTRCIIDAYNFSTFDLDSFNAYMDRFADSKYIDINMENLEWCDNLNSKIERRLR